MNYKFEKFVINYYADLPKILKNLDIYIQHNGLFFCPMHTNENTPAAKIFKDESSWAFYCFAEGRQYTAYDVLKEIYHLNMKVEFNNLWNSLSEEQKAFLQDKFGEYDTNSREVDNEDVYLGFYQHRINYQQLKLLLEHRLRTK